MSRAIQYVRELRAEAVVEGGSQEWDIPRAHDLRSLGILLDGELVIGTAAATEIPAHSPAELVSRVELKAGGRNMLDNVSPRLVVFGAIEREFDADVLAPGTGVATHPFRAYAFFDRVNAGGPRPKDSAFQTYRTNLLELRCEFGTAADIATPDATTTLTLQNTTVQPFMYEERDGDRGEPKWTRIRSQRGVNFAAADAQLELEMPRSNFISRLVVLATDDGEPSDDLINSIEYAINVTDTRWRTSYDHARALNRRKTHAAIPAGFAVLEASQMNSIRDAFDVRRDVATENTLVFDVNAPAGTTGRIDVLIEEYIPPMGGANGQAAARNGNAAAA